MSDTQKPNPLGMQRIYIDKVTGTWGDANDLVIVDAPNFVVNWLDGLSDSEITKFAKQAEGLVITASVNVSQDPTPGSGA